MAEVPLITLNPAPAEGPKIAFADGKTTIQNPEVLQRRADKADYALADKSPGKAALLQDYALGFEERPRELARLAMTEKIQKGRQDRIRGIVDKANAEFRTIAPEEEAEILKITGEDGEAGETALEERYARRLMEEAKENPEVSDVTAPVLVKQQVAQRIKEEYDQKAEDQSWGGFAWDFAEGIVPLKSSANLMKDETSWVTGDNIRQQLMTLYALPPEQFEEAARARIAEIADTNLLDAVQFADALIKYSASSRVLDNAFMGLDVLDVATLGATGAAGVVLKSGKSRSIVKAAAKGLGETDRLVLTGNSKQAAEAGVKKTLAKAGMGPGDVTAGPVNIPQLGMSFGDPENYLRNVGSLTNERQRRLMDTIESVQGILKTTVDDMTSVQRLEGEGLTRAFQVAEQRFRTQNYRMVDSVLDVARVVDDQFGGVSYNEITIGKKDASLFDNVEQADNYARRFYKLQPSAYDVEQVGNSAVIKVKNYVDETEASVLNARVTTDNVAPETLVNRYLGWLRTPEDIRSKQLNEQAKIATYGSTGVLNRMQQAMAPLTSLGKNEHNRLAAIMNKAQHEFREVIDPVSKKKEKVAGRFYQDVGELEAAYMKEFKSLPSQAETEAYFTFREFMDYDHQFRNISQWRDKTRQGIEQIELGWAVKNEGEEGGLRYVKTPFFEGKELDALPARDTGDAFTVAWIDDKSGYRFKTSAQASETEWADLQAKIADGYKVFKVFDDRPLRDLIHTADDIQYIVAKPTSRKPLSFNQVGYQEGGHWIYPQYGSYVKRANTKYSKGTHRRLYRGDTTFHYAADSKEGKALVADYETARQMLVRNDPNFDAFVTSRLPQSPDEFRALLGEDVNAPFVLTQQGQRALDVDNLDGRYPEKVTDTSNSAHGWGSVFSEFTQGRDRRLTGVRDEGTEGNPLFKLHAAPTMDAMDALARSTSSLIKHRYFDDFKHKSFEDFITQFQGVIDEPIDRLRSNPGAILHDIKWKEKGDPEKLAAAKNNLASLKYLLGQDNATVANFKLMRQKILESTGFKGKILDPWEFEKTTDPASQARSLVVNLKLGMFNVGQYFLQSAGAVQAFAIDGNPIRAAQASFLMWSMRMRGLTRGEAASSFMGKGMAKVLGIDQNIVDEIYQGYRNSGMSIVGGEHGRLDDFINPKEFFQGNVAKGLNWGLTFFHEGNQVHRGVAYALAHLKWRQENPTAKLTNQVMAQIVNRADTLGNNMTRASNNQWLNSGWQSIATQFTSYHTRMMEQFWSGRLTMAEKARLVGLYSAAFGIPVGVGIPAAAVWPVSEQMRQAAQERGMTDDPDLATKAMLNGVAQVSLEMLTGKDYNVSTRFGPGGLTFLPDLLSGNFSEVAIGPAGGTIGELLGKMDPFVKFATSAFFDDEYYPIGLEDFNDVAREISLWNNANKAYWALNAHAYMTKGERKVADMPDADAMDAFLMVAVGLNPQMIEDHYLKADSVRDRSAFKTSINREVTKYYERMLKYSAEGDLKNAEIWHKRVQAVLKGSGYSEKEKTDLLRRIIRDNKSQMEKVDRTFGKEFRKPSIVKESE